jgi:hypothetical protein
MAEQSNRRKKLWVVIGLIAASVIIGMIAAVPSEPIPFNSAVWQSLSGESDARYRMATSVVESRAFIGMDMASAIQQLGTPATGPLKPGQSLGLASYYAGRKRWDILRHQYILTIICDTDQKVTTVALGME